MIEAEPQFFTGKKWTNLLPLVVPPIHEKAVYYRKALAPLWKAASKAMKHAEKLIVFGYSFPEADYAARSLFRRATFENKGLREVAIIDTDPKVIGKISELVKVDGTYFYRNVPALCRSIEF